MTLVIIMVSVLLVNPIELISLNVSVLVDFMTMDWLLHVRFATLIVNYALPHYVNHAWVIEYWKIMDVFVQRKVKR